MGSAGAPAPMADTAFSAPVTSVYESVQNVPVPHVGVGLDDTAQPGQLAEGITGVGVTTTGAGQGSGHAPHPNAESSGSLAAQAGMARS